MFAVTIVLVLLLALVASTFVARLLPWKLPLPLLQILIGAGLSEVIGFDIEFEPHLFLLLFIPPLLFLDGWRIPKGALFQNWRPILTMAIGLVVFTVAAMGYFIHWLLPAVPLAVAFALAAILSPTDPVAVGAMTADSPLPSRLMHILEGESLLNDATGLVCFSFAVAAVLTGSFSLAQASLSFVVVAGGGVLTGLGVTWAIGRLNRVLVARAGEEPGIQILISLLIPFAAYLAGEHLHVSGILAAAVAGVAMHYVELSGPALAVTRTQRSAVWDTVQIALNGGIFLLLGAQLPTMIDALPAVAGGIGAASPWHLLGYAGALTLALGALRFTWVWLYHFVASVPARLRGERHVMPHVRLLAIKATAGVRGAITLAGILTLPLALQDSTPFPAREAVILLAMGVIIFSLLIASVGLPLLTRGLKVDLQHAAHEDGEAVARISATEAAMRRIEEIVAEAAAASGGASAYDEAGLQVLDLYRRRLDYGDHGGEDLDSLLALMQAERDLRLQALAAEREQLFRLRRSRSIDCNVLRKLVHEIDLLEISLSDAPGHG
ncbi:monovalent cation:H+ antiporter, CPA1 family [Pseudomonas linyingensis]|uniref:Monovalent cation:H+ antiporter, CPA1 family n=1 Tax=Pseudomonas linyingensis TaxID=915471 RepID=A0A1H6VRP2_9PSED|nr:Na+/H+ antiporter [Pseudomonas linyingensis]SEJ06386.1 monovalent cation:H+ antiporter, CPA1 family [Pseudomonas linyingensis]